MDRCEYAVSLLGLTSKVMVGHNLSCSSVKLLFTCEILAFIYLTLYNSPGRWFASHMLKQVLVQFLTNYDYELLDTENCKPLRWTTSLVPRLSIQMSVRPRKLK